MLFDKVRRLLAADPYIPGMRHHLPDYVVIAMENLASEHSSVGGLACSPCSPGLAVFFARPPSSACCRPAFSPVRDAQATYEKLLTEVPKYKMITPSVLSDRLRVSPLLPFRHLSTAISGLLC